MQEFREVIVRRASIGQTVAAVLWSFFGVRKGRDHERDMVQLNPVVVIITGVVAAVLFVLSLVMVVKLVLS